MYAAAVFSHVHRQTLHASRESFLCLRNHASSQGAVGINLGPHPVPAGGRPPLRATSSATVFVNLLDLNDNDPTFQNLPFIAEISEGLPAGTSVFQVSSSHQCWKMSSFPQ